DQPVGLLVELMDRATLRDRVHMRAGFGRAARVGRLERIPIADPKIQLMIFRCGSAVRARGRRGGRGGMSQRDQQRKYKNSSRHDRLRLHKVRDSHVRYVSRGQVEATTRNRLGVLSDSKAATDASARAVERLAVFGLHYPECVHRDELRSDA